MKTQDPHRDLADGIEPAPVPPVGPDGVPQIPALRVIPPIRPSLCHVGPCKRYHRFVVQVDASDPRAVSVPIRLPEGTPGVETTPTGSVYRAPAVYHTAVHHYCYPDTGIEMPLGALPVTECNRWDPRDPPPGELRRLNGGQRPGGMKGDRVGYPEHPGPYSLHEHQESVGGWEAARAAEAESAAEVEREIAESMQTDRIRCQGCGHEFEEAELDITMRCRSCATAMQNPKEPR